MGLFVGKIHAKHPTLQRYSSYVDTMVRAVLAFSFDCGSSDLSIGFGSMGTEVASKLFSAGSRDIEGNGCAWPPFVFDCRGSFKYCPYEKLSVEVPTD